MEMFRNLLEFFGFYDETRVDFVTKLPTEISSIILGMLDAQSFKSAIKVSRQWRSVCRHEKKRRQARKNKINTIKYASIYAARKRCIKNILFGEEYKNCTLVTVAPYFNHRSLPSSQAVFDSKRHRHALRTIRF
jgi:hypothetical protein